LHSGSLPDEYEKRSWDKVRSLADAVKEEKDQEQKKEVKPQISVLERIDNKASELISDLEEQIDKFLTDHNASDFNADAWFKINSIKPPIAKKISNYYRPLLDELGIAMSGDDPDIKYAYRRWGKKDLKKYVSVVKGILSAAETTLSSVKPANSVVMRKKKERPVHLVVSKLKFKEKDESLGVSSINPISIVSANQLWVYNTRRRTVSSYVALGPSGLNVKGTRIIGFDSGLSVTKKVKDQKKTVEAISKGDRSSIKKLMSEMTTKGTESNGIINKDTLLLKAMR
jgi:hypothetical protein